MSEKEKAMTEYALAHEIIERIGLDATARRIELVRRMIVLLESSHFDEPVMV